MTITRINSVAGCVTARTVTVTVNVARTSHASVTAPPVSGYTFVCWTHCATDGWVGQCYMQVPTSATSYVWVSYSASTSGTGKVVCCALYRKNS